MRGVCCLLAALAVFAGCSSGSSAPQRGKIEGMVTVNGKPMNFAGDLYWGKRYAYAVMVIFPASPADPAGTQKFIGSFGVLGK